MNLTLLKDSRKISKFFVLVLLLFLLVFPKGGIKIYNLPLTWGYLFLAILSFGLLLRKKYTVNKNHVYILLALLPFQMLSLITIFFNGFTTFGFALSFVIGFFALPFIFLFIFSEYIENIDFEYFSILLKRGILFIASYGIFLFFFRTFMGYFFEIPLLTINFHDRAIMDHTKSIERGAFFKLISTYNSGTLYGICLLMVLPLYHYLEKNILKKNIVRLSLLLTISRTVWIGFVLSEFFYNFFIKKDKKLSLLNFLVFSIIFLISFHMLLKLIDFSYLFLFDPNLGGRLAILEDFKLSLFSKNPFFAIRETVYVSVLKDFGFVGLIFFIIALFSPLAIYFKKYYRTKPSCIKKTVAIGLLTYLIIAFSDGAMPFLPTMAFYWFFSSFLLTGS